MTIDTSLGSWLRSERERRGITLKSVADQTKVAAPLLEGLESGDLSRWPGGIYRRAFVKAYASALGLDADEVVRRFEREHPAPEAVERAEQEAASAAAQSAASTTGGAVPTPVFVSGPAIMRHRLRGTAADLTVALILGLGSAAAGSRLLWPVLLIAAYYGIGVLLTGTSPMVALLTNASTPPQPALEPPAPAPAVRPAVERRHQPRRGARPQRQNAARQARARVQ